jgi:N-acetylmuramoyl-L-alanine amidase
LNIKFKKQTAFLFFALLLLLLPLIAYPQTIKLIGLRILQTGSHTRLIFSLNKPFQYHCFTLIKPDRLIIDFSSTRLALPLQNLKFGHQIIKNIRTGIQQPNHNLRVVFELKQTLTPKPYILKPYGRFGYRLVIDLLAKSQPLRKSKKVAIKQTSKKALRNVIIVIDPGHGGKDTGAPGQLGTYEKNVVLAIAKNLYALLKKQPGVDPRLTRSGDYFVPLRRRLRLARQGWTDMFIAIHADAYKNHASHGASVFALSQHGATSEAARWLAQKENYSELMGGVNLDDKSYLLRSVLIDLSQTATIRESLALGNNIMHSLSKVAKLHVNRVEQAPFVVLKSPDIPSLLIETGFISNRHEELLLRNPTYQKKIAQAIAHGILNYLHQHPPSNTTLAVFYQRMQRHIVRHGENLTAIARHYGINVAILKKINHLTSPAINVGQILQIPRQS